MEGLGDDSQGRHRNNWKKTLTHLRNKRKGVVAGGVGDYNAPLMDSGESGGQPGAYVQMSEGDGVSQHEAPAVRTLLSKSSHRAATRARSLGRPLMSLSLLLWP